ncbi:MAG: hypothetical protein GAK45_02205 [Pseudomonas citronellolis]|nr:MAG: hypothetical protein GAK45_02205 [Pseudomonas citronellolis]
MHTVEQVAERRLAVGIAHRAVEAGGRREVGQLAVVGEGPVTSAHFAYERVGVGQTDLADVGLADVPDHRFALDRIALHQARDFRVAARGRVLEQAHTTAFVEGDAPTVTVGAGAATALHQPGEAEHDIGGDIGAHAKQFAHTTALRVAAQARHDSRGRGTGCVEAGPIAMLNAPRTARKGAAGGNSVSGCHSRGSIRIRRSP